MDNPYSEMARAFAPKESGGTLRFGTVTGISPLAVNVGGLEIKKGIFVNESLLPAPQKAEISLPGSQVSEPDGSITFSEPLKTGDRVLLYSDDDQVFYIICKVVSA